jgi:hypothetical protein
MGLLRVETLGLVGMCDANDFVGDETLVSFSARYLVDYSGLDQLPDIC